MNSLFVSVLIIFSIYLTFTTVKDFFIKNQINFSQKISHFGFSLLILSIIINGTFSKEITTNIEVGEKFKNNNVVIYFEKISALKEKNHMSIIGNFKIKENDKNEILFKPELRIFNQPTTVTSEADIKISLTEDKFLVMNLVKGNDYYNIRYQTKPFMIWIWLSAIIMCIGPLINFVKKRYNEK